jgi:tRNA threonylcarbamoyladenosine biosynthesis protein TsaE
LGESKFEAPSLNSGQALIGIDLMNEFAHQPIVKTLHWPNEAATRLFATALSARAELSNCLIELRGELGAGKTTLVRHLLHALGVQGRIKSPTYAVLEPYELSGLAIWHFDFYRFNDPQEWEDAGFRDIFASPGLKLVEWPQKAAGFLPRADLVIDLQAIDDDARQVTLMAQSATGLGLLSGPMTEPASGREA